MRLIYPIGYICSYNYINGFELQSSLRYWETHSMDISTY